MTATMTAPAPTPADMPTRLDAVTHNGWRVTRHARIRAHELGYSLDEIVRAAVDPEVTYAAAGYDPRNRTHQRGDLTVVVNVAQRNVITVLLRREDRWEHGTDHRPESDRATTTREDPHP